MPILGSGFPVVLPQIEQAAPIRYPGPSNQSTTSSPQLPQTQSPENAKEMTCYKELYDGILKLAKGEYLIPVYDHTTPAQVLEGLGKKMKELKEERDTMLKRAYQYECRGEELFEENKKLKAELRALNEGSTPATSPEPDKPVELEAKSEDGESATVAPEKIEAKSNSLF
jgi:hypothetical protein